MQVPAATSSAVADYVSRLAAFWEERLAAAGQEIPRLRPSARTRLLTLLARYLGIAFIVPTVIAREMKDRDEYTGQDDARTAGLAQDEHAHAAALRARWRSANGYRSPTRGK